MSAPPHASRSGPAPTALIVTLEMDAAAAIRYTALRRAHFPAQRNWLAAHITLFHALPVASLDAVASDMTALAGTTRVLDMSIDKVLFLGRGVAYGVACADGVALRRALAARWDALLGRQDRAWAGRLHITVQNKVEPATARALHAQLAQDFRPEQVEATGLGLWYYLGGPWRAAGTFAFVR